MLSCRAAAAWATATVRWWEESRVWPRPVGGTALRRDLGTQTIRDISRLLKESIRYALAHRDDALTYALKYARDMDKALADRFVGMYVNDWTLDYGPRGRAAVRRLLEEGHRAGIIPSAVAVEFVDCRAGRALPSGLSTVPSCPASYTAC